MSYVYISSNLIRIQECMFIQADDSGEHHYSGFRTICFDRFWTIGMTSIIWSCILCAASGLSYTDLESLESRETARPGIRVVTVGALDAQPEVFTYTTQGRPVYPLIPSATENTANSPTSAFVSTSPLNLAAHHEASSIPSYASCAPFPSMYRGMNAIEWDSKANEWNAAQEEISGDHIKYWADCMPVVRLPELMYDLEIDNLSNEKQVFTNSGFINGEAIWFKEVENRTREDPVVFYLHGGELFMGLDAESYPSCKLIKQPGQ